MKIEQALTNVTPIDNIEMIGLSETFDQILTRFGVETTTPDLQKTPLRYLKALHEITKGLREPCPEMTTFSPPVSNTGKSPKVVVRDIAFSSICEHHLLPYFGTVEISYRPNQKMLGLSKFARYVEWESARPSTQETLTLSIATGLGRLLGTKVKVSISARHTCACVRGAKSNFVTDTHYTYQP
jgi:GTP cyclohydrolase IA